jgi:hypoxia up-regulated 1
VTDAERADVVALVEKAETWLADKVAAQAKLAGSEAPAFTALEVAASLKPTANLVTKLSRKPAPKPVLVLNATNATEAANATAAAANATAAAANATEPAANATAAAEGVETEASAEAAAAAAAAGDDEL